MNGIQKTGELYRILTRILKRCLITSQVDDLQRVFLVSFQNSQLTVTTTTDRIGFILCSRNRLRVSGEKTEVVMN